MIGSKANMGNSFPVQFQVENTKQLDIKAGMFGKVIVSNNQTEKGFLIPSSAILNNEEKRKSILLRTEKQC